LKKGNDLRNCHCLFHGCYIGVAVNHHRSQKLLCGTRVVDTRYKVADSAHTTMTNNDSNGPGEPNNNESQDAPSGNNNNRSNEMAAAAAAAASSRINPLFLLQYAQMMQQSQFVSNSFMNASTPQIPPSVGGVDSSGVQNDQQQQQQLQQATSSNNTNDTNVIPLTTDVASHHRQIYDILLNQTRLAEQLQSNNTVAQNKTPVANTLPESTIPRTGQASEFPAVAWNASPPRTVWGTPVAAEQPSGDPPNSANTTTTTTNPLMRMKRPYRHESFPEKLWRMLIETKENGQDDIISFMPSGTSFKVHKPDSFTEDVVPNYFRHKRYASFRRQLSMYGFERVQIGPEEGAFAHPMFHRDHPELAQHIQRLCDFKDKEQKT